MRKIDALRAAKTKHSLALLLGVKTSYLTYVLYALKPSTQYFNFKISKKCGGERTISAPTESLKSLQSSLSLLLQDCIDEIHSEKGRANGSSLSHGFVRHRSIITNAMMHLHKKNVLNIDLSGFFDSFNFGRVRGFFIKNKDFQLDANIATVIAQIACYENALPQGSPCSPVISNLITHSLDIKLAALARRYSCIYSRYADDITFSTREKFFPHQIMASLEGNYIPGKKLKSEIQRSGFCINDKKTRIQYKDSRQDVTGLVVNKKPNVKSEYWRTVRSQCHSLFRTGAYTKKENKTLEEGSILELEGKLNFIDQIDHHNRLRQKSPLQPEYALAKYGYKTSELFSGRERTLSRFLYYKFFYANEKPTILCEGQTDYIYLKSAINRLASAHPCLAKPQTVNDPYKLLITLFKYTRRTRFLLQLHGGAKYLDFFIKLFSDNFAFYKAPHPKKPVIIVLDNDQGCNDICQTIIGNKLTKVYAKSGIIDNKDVRKADFVHVAHNLYVVFTPRSSGDANTEIEDLFQEKTRKERLGIKTLNLGKSINTETEYGKEPFAKKVVLVKKASIDFSGFNELLSRIEQCITHYNSIH